MVLSGTSYGPYTFYAPSAAGGAFAFAAQVDTPVAAMGSGTYQLQIWSGYYLDGSWIESTAPASHSFQVDADRFPDGALVPLALGELDFEQERYGDAYEDFSLSFSRSARAEAHAGMVASLVNLGVQRYRKGDRAGAADSFEQALGPDPASLEALKNLALVRVETGRTADALPLLERAVAAAPTDMDAWKMLAGAAETEGPRKERERALRRWAELAPLDPAPVAALGRLLESEGRGAEAEAAYARAAELGSDDPHVAYAEARRRRSVAEAQVAVSGAVRQAGALRVAALAVLDRARGRPDAAAQAAVAQSRRRLKEARSLLKDSLDLLATLRADPEVFDEDLARFLSWYPNTTELKEEAATRYAAQGRWSQALPLWLDVLRDDPRNAGAQAAAGEALRGLGRLAESLIFFRRALSQDRQSPRRYGQLIGVYRELGREDELRALLADRLLADPHNGALTSAVAELGGASSSTQAR